MPDPEEKQVEYRVLLPDSMRQRFKGMTAMNGTNMKDVLLDFIAWYIGDRKEPPENKHLQKGDRTS